MRDGEVDYKGKFWVGQRVRVGLTKTGVIGKKEIACDIGIIRAIYGRFLRTPDLTVISYRVWFDSQALKQPFTEQGIKELNVTGDFLEPI